MRDWGDLPTVEAVYRKYARHLQRLKQRRDQAGDSWTDLQELQVRVTESFLEDLGKTWGTDGHGRPNIPEEATA